MKFERWRKETLLCVSLLAVSAIPGCWLHEAKDFDDSILYNIEFDIPDFDKNPELKNNLKPFYTLEKEKYQCVIPSVDDVKTENKPGEAKISPLTLIHPVFSAASCSYRIEAYWSYEICHGYHIRQYHEEREGKNIKFQEYYLGKWSDEKTVQLNKVLEEERKAGIKHKTIKIDNIKYPYFEMEMTDGTMCDIINEPRTTKIRYVCYPHIKTEQFYSFKETSSCHYEAIILTSLLCMDPAFHPEGSKEFSIKCFNSLEKTHKPLSMLRMELQAWGNLGLYDLPSENKVEAAVKQEVNTEHYMLLNKFGTYVNNLAKELKERSGNSEDVQKPPPPPPVSYLSLIKLLSGQNCLTGGTGWWKYEFCHRIHVRQFHKHDNFEAEIYLGYFNEWAHRQWITMNPDKAFKKHQSTSIWHHYESGSRCDRTSKPREVDVKLTCTPTNPTSVSMYLLEPKTCQYILVVESSIICSIMQITDEFGLVDLSKVPQLFKDSEIEGSDLEESPAEGTSEQIEVKSESSSLNPTGATGTVSEVPSEEVEVPPGEEVHD